jgi:hypothetical protein
MADKSLSVMGGTYGTDDSGIVWDSNSEAGTDGGGMEDNADEGSLFETAAPVGGALPRSARGPVGTF